MDQSKIRDLIRNKDIIGLLESLGQPMPHADYQQKNEWFKELDGSAVVESLIPALKDEDARIRSRAVYWLKIIGDFRALEPLTRYFLKNDDILSLLEFLGRPAREWSVEQRHKWIKELAGSEVMDMIIAGLKDEDERICVNAAKWLAMIGDLRSVEPIIVALQDKDDVHLREQAASALGVLRDKRAVVKLIAALDDESANLRQSAAWALGEIGDVQALQPLSFVALNDQLKSTRSYTVDDRWGLVADEEYYPVREAAQKAISKIRGSN